MVFLEVWRRRDSVPDTRPAGAEGSVLPWLYGVANNVVRNHARSLRRHRAALERCRRACANPTPPTRVAERLDAERRMQDGPRATSPGSTGSSRRSWRCACGRSSPTSRPRSRSGSPSPPSAPGSPGPGPTCAKPNETHRPTTRGGAVMTSTKDTVLDQEHPRPLGETPDGGRMSPTARRPAAEQLESVVGGQRPDAPPTPPRRGRCVRRVAVLVAAGSAAAYATRAPATDTSYARCYSPVARGRAVGHRHRGDGPGGTGRRRLRRPRAGDVAPCGGTSRSPVRRPTTARPTATTHRPCRTWWPAC